MKRVLAALLLLAPVAALAQSMSIGVDRSVGGPSYTGPGDVVSGALSWWGLRAYNTAWATGLNKIANICTPSDAVCADVNSDASGNFNLAGTGSLTCNNSGSICTVKTLYDQSGASKCSGPCDVTNTTIANRPILVTAGGCPAGSGTFSASRVCMSTPSAGGGAQSLCASADWSAGASQPFQISAAYINPSRTGDEYLFDTSNFGAPFIISGFGGANAITIGHGVSNANATANDNVWHAIQGIYNNTSSDINVDGSAASGFPLTIGTTNAIGTIRICLFNVTGPTGGSNAFGGYAVEYGMWANGSWLGGSSSTSTSMYGNQHLYWGF